MTWVYRYSAILHRRLKMSWQYMRISACMEFIGWMNTGHRIFSYLSQEKCSTQRFQKKSCAEYIPMGLHQIVVDKLTHCLQWGNKCKTKVFYI